MSGAGNSFAERLAAIGDMGARIAGLSGRVTPLGGVESWSAALRTTVALMLRARAEIVLFWGPDYVALYNDAYAPTIGDKHPRALGRPARENWAELWHDLEPLLRGVRETEETFAAKDRPFYIERHGGKGETVYFDVSYSAVPEEDGSVGGILCIVSETTSRVLAERRVREANEMLEQRVEAALADRAKAEDALRQSQKMEAMGRLTGGVAHDFNNLLTPIIGGLDFLQRRAVGNDREQRLISGAMQSAERARTLVQRLLAFARRQPLQPVAVDIESLIEEMSELIKSTVGPKINVTLLLERPLAHAHADPNQLEMALLNLAVNARDAMAEGGSLTISAANEKVEYENGAHLRPGGYVKLSIRDTGAGMDSETLKRAVEPFFSTKGVGKGTGLGLSMVDGLASQLGGALTIESRPEFGTTVELWLPQSTAAIQARPGETTQPAALVTGTALLVDDEPLVRMTTASMLTDLGFTVLEANSAEGALQLIDEGLRPNVLITDHLMAGMTGSELARRLRDDGSEIPVLIISGYAEEEGIAPDLPRLTKPFRNDELALSLAELTSK